MDLKNKNILLVIHQGQLGGAERQGLGISKLLTNDNNCNVDLLLTFSGNMSNDFKDFAKTCNIRNIYHFGKPYLVFRREFSYRNFKRLIWSLKYLFRLRKGLRNNDYDIIIPFLNFPSKVAYYLYKLLPTVKFTFWHQLGLDTLSLDIFESIAAKNIPCVIGNASNCLDMFKSPYKIDPKKLNVLPQYITMEHKNGNKNELRAKYLIPQEAIVIGMIAHFREEKLFGLLLNAFRILCEKHDNIYLVLLGGKNISSATMQKFKTLKDRIDEEQMTSKISLLSGLMPEDVLNCIDIGVLVSRIEGMPNVVMEYMLYGLPVVATKHPGCIQLLGESKFLIENKEVDLCNKLDELILSEPLRYTEGEINSKKIKRFNMEAYVKNLESIMNNYIC